MKRGIFITSLVIILTIISSQLMAQEGSQIRIGKMKISPGLGLQAVYDDNIYLGNGSNNTTEVEESDWITHVMPSLMMVIPISVTMVRPTTGAFADRCPPHRVDARAQTC